jgi:hypothetical protein
MLRVNANFEQDLCKMAEQDLEARGIPRWEWKHARPRERRDVIRQLLTAEHRLIPVGRRQTIWSDLLKSRADDEWLQEATTYRQRVGGWRQSQSLPEQADRPRAPKRSVE